MFFWKCVLKIYSKFTGEHPCWSAMSIKLLCDFIEMALRHRCSPENLLHIFGTAFYKSISVWLLLSNLTVLFQLLFSWWFGSVFFLYCSSTICRHSHQRCSIKKSYLKNFTKFTGKHLCQSLLFNKVAGLGPATLLKRDAGTGVFKNNCFIEHLQMTLSASTLAQLAKLSQWKKNLLDQILLIWKLNYVILKNWWSRLIALPNPFIHNVEKWYF